MEDLVSEFIAETTENLAVLDQELVRFEQEPNDKKILGNIFRIVHTVKGTCGFLNLTRLEKVAHASENVLGKIRDGELQATQQAISLILKSLDVVKSLVEFIGANNKEPDGSDDALIADLNRFAESGATATAAPVVYVPPAAVSGEDFSTFFKGDADLDALIAAESAKKAPASSPPPPVVVAEKEAPKEEKPTSVKEGAAGATQFIRVNLDILEHLMQTVSELVLTRNQLMQIVRKKENQELTAPMQHLSQITTELQEGIMKTRMQPISNAWSKFPRLIRDLSLELGKKIELVMHGEETELDRQLLEMIKDPLTHMVRNSCDHGLEKPEDRKSAGKTDVGKVTLSAYHEGGHIVIKIADDGKGINLARIKEKALANGIATADEIAAMSDQQIMQFIFAAGFSTAEKVTAVSGRGVGMDVVRTNIEKIGGTVEIDSALGKGSTFAIKIPLTLAIVSVLIVSVEGEKFALPQMNVVELVKISKNAGHTIEMINGAPVFRLRGNLLPLGALSHLLNIKTEPVNWAARDAFVVVCNVGGSDFGVVVDRIFGIEEIVVKPVTSLLKTIPVYSGNTILGDGSVIMILDPDGLAKAICHTQVANEKPDALDKQAQDKNKLSFLIFKAGDDTPKAVPLELIARLEEIDVKSIEIAGGEPAVQYRGELMRVVMLDEATRIPTEGKMQVVVFMYDRKAVGLVVEDIFDTVYVALDLQVGSRKKHCLGSMIISGKTTDMIDVAGLLSETVAQIPSAPSMNRTQEPCKVMLVEDSPFSRNITEPFLSSAGYKMTSAESGKQALDILAGGEKLDLIITDIEMPEMNGYEFARACLSNAKYAHIPIIAYTSTVSADVARKCKEAGILDCVGKTDRSGLLTAIAREIAARKKGIAA